MPAFGLVPGEIKFFKMEKDISSRKDIEKLIFAFYEKVKADKQLAPFFAKTNWEKHLPVMYRFWENAIFYTGTYDGNPMTVHQTLQKRNPMNAKIFSQWIKLFHGTVDEMFRGEKAELIKQKAHAIATVMQVKIFQ